MDIGTFKYYFMLNIGIYSSFDISIYLYLYNKFKNNYLCTFLKKRFI